MFDHAEVKSLSDLHGVPTRNCAALSSGPGGIDRKHAVTNDFSSERLARIV